MTEFWTGVTVPLGGFTVVSLDPPWPYRVWSEKGKGRSAENHYHTMTFEDIRAIPVRDLLAKNAMVLLWGVPPSAPEVFRTAEAWGLAYVTMGFDWVKLSKRGRGLHWGNGHHTRANSEQCWLFRTGKGLQRKSKRVHSVIISPVDRHSAKPQQFYKRVMTLWPGETYLEVFARAVFPGWQGWGDEAGSIEHQPQQMALGDHFEMVALDYAKRLDLTYTEVS